MMEINNLNYLDKAEEVISKLKRNKYGNIELTTSKIRNILAMISEIYNEVIHESGDKLSQESQERIQYLRLRITYEAGREQVRKNEVGAVKDFVEQSELLEMLKRIGNNKSKFLLFARYFEALVAYHRYQGGKDN